MTLWPTLSFSPTADVAVILHNLLDGYERRGGAPKQIVRVKLDEIVDVLPAYNGQTDPVPRTTANEQLAQLEKQGLVRLFWQPGQTGHLLDAVALESDRTELLYTLLEREALADRRGRLRSLLLGDRFRLGGWRARSDRALPQSTQNAQIPRPF